MDSPKPSRGSASVGGPYGSSPDPTRSRRSSTYGGSASVPPPPADRPVRGSSSRSGNLGTSGGTPTRGSARPVSGSARPVSGSASVGSASGSARPVSGSARVGSARPVSGDSTGLQGRATPPGRGDRARHGSPGGPAGPGAPNGPGRPGGNGRGGSGAGGKKKGKKGRKRKIALISGFVVLLLLFGGVGAGYAAVQVPLPADVPRAQISTIYYDDGKTVLARIGSENRTDVPITKISKQMQFAMVSAEDHSFYENSGISPTGILRAVWSTITGGDVQGGSTITQQYVKNAYLSSEQTVTRKLKEIVLATKADQKYSKDQIMEFYLNTIAFGRGSYGIEAAAQSFFGVHASQLTYAQGAVLAGLVKSPNGAYDPGLHPQAAKKRWDYVMNGLVDLGKITKAERDATQYPKTLPRKESYGASTGLSGWSGIIVKRVEAELQTHGISNEQLETGGYQIVTTINKKAQDAAVRAQRDVLSDQPKELATALASVEPGTGKIKAYYGGEGGRTGFDLAAAEHPPGSSFKAYALAEAISQGISIKSVWNGSDNQMFPNETKPVKNSDGESCGNCTLIKATTLSLNTTFYALVAKVGAKKVIERAGQSGIRQIQRYTPIDQFNQPNIRSTALGQYSISVLDQADGFATFAANGTHAEPYFVQNVKRPDGGAVYQASPKTNLAFSPDVAADATYAMQTVVDTARHGGLDDRKAAGKTGTAQYQNTDQNAHAWMCGYTPQLATAVWIGHSKNDGPIKNSSGSIIYGSGLPYLIWQATMNGALKGDESKSFPDPKFLGDDTAGNGHLAPSPNPSGSVSPSPSGGVDGGVDGNVDGGTGGTTGGTGGNPHPTPTRGGGIFTGGPGQ
ncbi:transglycosylase domain-containing protein [Fodinicola acaciae]|uniref:transglycosylase domain-containing protein n=1 Tax=Fodinicola acaciae TaxID=2681555 RepID=UPI0013D3F0AE|nr:transglycosylase domain-containing protein [Fodinicola acaciae]